MGNNVERADEEPRTHPTSVALGRPPAAEVDAGTDIVLTVKVSCPYGCDLRERVINVIDARWRRRGGESACRLCRSTSTKRRNSPSWPRTRWASIRGRSYSRSTRPKALCTRKARFRLRSGPLAHDTSLAVWGVPSPIVIDHPFRIQVGATCSAGCDLKGKEIQICDETGASIARGTLGETPWDGTRALYWTEVDLVAPASEGATSRSIRFAPTELRLPHGGASARFGFETVKPPQYSVTVKVVQKDAGTPVEDAQVRLGVYFAYSDPTGLARVAMPRGTYSLDVLKTGYEAALTSAGGERRRHRGSRSRGHPAGESRRVLVVRSDETSLVARAAETGVDADTKTRHPVRATRPD